MTALSVGWATLLVIVRVWTNWWSWTPRSCLPPPVPVIENGAIVVWAEALALPVADPPTIAPFASNCGACRGSVLTYAVAWSV